MKIYKALVGGCDFSYLFIFSCHLPAATKVALTVQLVPWAGCTAFSKATVNLSLLTAHVGIRMCRRAGGGSPGRSLCHDSVSQLCALMVFHKVRVALSPEALKCCLISRASWLPLRDSDRIYE